MKMGKRNFKQIDRYCSRSQTKTRLEGKPTNRAERRKFQHVLKQEGVREDEIDQVALFGALKAHNAKK